MASGPSPQETVERALAAAKSDDCVVIAEETSTANLRWAGNTLTTNGVAGSRQLTVISIDRRGTGNRSSAATGVVSRAGVRADQIEDVVREAEHAAAEATPAEDTGELKYGSEVMNVTGDRTAGHGLASVGYDDEGVAGQSWDLIRDGVLAGYQLDRRMAALRGLGRSNGCAFSDGPGHMPLQRMANVSLQPAADGPSTADLIAGVENGIYILGDKSWSIDMQRYNFQFTGQRFFRIRNGRLDGQLRDAAYQATTTDFWGSMEAVGGPQTYVLGGAFNCGKGQPGQVAPVSHGCPSVLLRGVRILNTAEEGAS